MHNHPSGDPESSTEDARLTLAISRAALAVPGVGFCNAHYAAHGEWKLFASSEGTLIEQAQTRGQPFDLVVSDPPSFAPSERARGRAEAAYRKLHAAIAAVLDDGALLEGRIVA